jgi:hypothetical protein
MSPSRKPAHSQFKKKPTNVGKGEGASSLGFGESVWWIGGIGAIGSVVGFKSRVRSTFDCDPHAAGGAGYDFCGVVFVGGV